MSKEAIMAANRQLQSLYDTIAKTRGKGELTTWSDNIKTLPELFSFKRSKDLPRELCVKYGTPAIWSAIGSRFLLLVLEAGIKAATKADVVDIIEEMRKHHLHTPLAQRALLDKAVSLSEGCSELLSTIGFMGELAREDPASSPA